jgi:hypothetical protein
MSAYHHTEVIDFVGQDYLNSVEVAIETGTEQGNGTQILADRYKKVITIELDDIYYNEAKVKFANTKNVECHHGNSEEVLKRIIPTLTGPTMYWLDAHYMGTVNTDWEKSNWKGYINHSGCINNDESDSRNQNPIDRELQLIYNLHTPSAILYIDDLDKFDEQGNGTKDKMFVGENWTHLNLDRLVETLGNRVRDIKHTPYHQMLIFLKEK